MGPQESPKIEVTPSKSVEAEVHGVKTPTKTPEPKSSVDTEPVTPVIEVTKVSEEDVAEVEAAAKKMRDTLGGTSIEIVLSPAIKKPKSRLSPPTSPTSANNEESISKKLADAEERKKVLEQEKAKKLASQLERISLAKEKKGKEEEKFSAEVMEKIESKRVHAEELKKKQMEEFNEKVSEHASKIEKAQKELEAAIEAAKAETQAAIDKRMNNAKENKDVQLEEMMTALKDHSNRVKNVRTNLDDQMKPKARSIIENIAKKEESSRELKAKQEAERKLKVEEMEKRRELVRLNKEKIVTEQTMTPEQA